MRPLAIELFAGSFGWGAGLVAEGWRSVGFDISHEPYHGPVPEHCELVIQDVLTLHGSQFSGADLIVASPPCQRYSYMAMPWRRSKAIAANYRAHPHLIENELNVLFNSYFRLQDEASAAAGRFIPMVVENVKGAQPWVGRAAWHYGSFYLWGDVPALMPSAHRLAKVSGLNWSGSDQPGYVAKAFNDTAIEQGRKVPGFNFHQFHQFEKTDKSGGSFQSAAVKNGGNGSWFAIGSPGQKQTGGNPDGRKVDPCAFYGTDGGPLPDGGMDRVLGNLHDDCGTGKTVAVFRDVEDDAGRKGRGDPRRSDGLKNARNWWSDGAGTLSATTSSKSSARKAASAAIAKIPFELSTHIGRVYFPTERAA